VNKDERRIQAYLSGRDAGLSSTDVELNEIADLLARFKRGLPAPPMAARIRAEERMLTALADRAARSQRRERSPFFAALPKAALMALGLFALSGLGVTASAAVGGPNVPSVLLAAVGIEMPQMPHLDFGPFDDAPKDSEAGQQRAAETVTLTPASVASTATPSISDASAPSMSPAPSNTGPEAPSEPDSGTATAPPSAPKPVPAPVAAPAPAPPTAPGNQPTGQDNGKEQEHATGHGHP
jgi:hypothetical protein